VDLLKIGICTVVLSLPTALLAGEANVPCDKHAANSEFSWNPTDQFVTPRLSRFYGLEQNIESAYLAGNDDQVKSLATEYLELSSTYRCNWNFGNAVHDANRYLGLVSLRNGHAEQAAAFLELSGKTPGSPQLDSFGPDLDLADRLLKRGQIKPVEQYLKDIRVFWKHGDGQIDRWLAAIARGERPTLNRAFATMNSSWVTAAKFFGWAWPELIVLIFLYAARKRLARKLLFVVAGSVIAYATSYLGSRAFALVMLKASPIMLGSHNLVAYCSVLSLSALLAIAIPILAVFALSRFCYRRNELTPG
jgi:hypothetical protein